ncbi:class I SAM-dependent methyltransferase [Halalkalibacter urbisdiaboli]|uniref:class I SAM-dependent methyltransferase n=1 Tax=Halalkalibacter urbisdiaboli TaxID=1960589 RepID=UPI000B44B394|nr:class I SAM-dependent methyltransferase [Halalkalibacter urbisdiaboli]
MKLLGILPFARFLLEQALEPGDIAIDCTAGNGHDTLFLANIVTESGKVYSFDIQEQAIKQTQIKMEENGINNRVCLINQGHETVAQVIPDEEHRKVKAAIFNLGYLPGGDKDIVTRPDSTLQAIQALLTIMPKGGTIVLVIYHGHEEGKNERKEVETFTEALDQRKAHVLKYQFTNQANNPPFIIAIEKR